MLDERERDGLLVDVCARCRGVWLDRGELEKLIARATRELEEVTGRREAPLPRDARPRDDGDDDDDDGRHPKRKRGWMHSLGDLFD